MTDSVVFYRSFYEALKELKPSERVAVYDAIFGYVFEDAEPELRGISNAAWILIQPQLDANIRRQENGAKGGEYGKCGGRPKGTKNSTKNPIGVSDKNPIGVSEHENKNPIGVSDDGSAKTPNVNVNDNVNVNVKKENKKKKSVVDSPPSRDEVRDYVRKSNLAIDADAFFDYFTEMEWVDSNGNPVLSWKGKARTWDGFKKEQPKKPQPFIGEGGFVDDLDMIEKLQGGQVGGG